MESALLAVSDAGGEAGLSTIEAAIPGGGSQADASRVAQRLRDLGLAEPPSSMTGTVTLSLDGRNLALKIKQARLNGPERWDAVERAIVTDLVQNGSRNASDWGVVSVDGKEIEAYERVNAMQRLSDWRYLTGIRAEEYDGFVRIDVTPKAHEVAGIDGLLADHHRPAASSSYHYSSSTTFGDGNTVGAVQTGGSGNTQQVSQTLAMDQRALVLAQVGGLLRSLEDAEGDTSGVRSAVEAIKDEASSDNATPESLKDRIVQALVVAGASEGGKVILQGLTHLLGMVMN